MAEGEERPRGGGDDENGKCPRRQYPIGFRFVPTTEELVEFYLLPKLLGEPTVPNEFVIEADTYECDPEILTEKYKEGNVDDTWYFLSPRNRKYPGGKRPVRRTADKRGRWKPSTGQSKPHEEDGASKPAFTFSENTLAYYLGTTNNETKTKWLMHELVVPETPGNGFHGRSAATEPRNPNLLNRYVACRIYKSPLRKWKEIEAAEAEEEVPTDAPALASSSKQPPAKRTAVERPAASGRPVTGAPNKGVPISQATLCLGAGRSAPTRGHGSGSSVFMPAVGVGAGAVGRHGPAGMPALVHWPPPVYNSMQGPVQVQQPPLVYGYGNRSAGVPNANGQAAPGQGPPPVARPRQPHQAAATAPNSLGPGMTMRPPNLPAGQPDRLSSPRQQQQQQPPPQETDEECRNRVYARLIAEMKLRKAREGGAARAGQQQQHQISQTAAYAKFPAPHGAHPYSSSSSSSSSNLAQGPQRQQSSSAAPTPVAVEKAPMAENVPSKQSVAPPGANEGSCKGNAATATMAADNIVLQILTADWTLTKN